MSNGDARAGTPRRIQHGIPRPEMVRSYPREPNEAASAVQSWLDRERLKPGGGLSPVEVAVLERCIEDLR